MSIIPNLKNLKSGKILFTFKGEEESELSCPKGTLVLIAENCEDGWSYCHLSSNPTKSGYIPTEYIKEIPRNILEMPKSSKINLVSDSNRSIFIQVIKQVYSRLIQKRVKFFMQQNRFKKQRKRMHQINETIKTEDTYIKQITFCVKNIRVPLVKMNVINDNQDKVLFGNIVQLRDCSIMLHSELVKSKEAEPPEYLKIAHCFKKISPFFKLYKVYLNNYENALGMIEKIKKKNSSFVKFIDKISSQKDSFNLKMKDFFLVPVMRIPRYRLLMENIIKYTPETHVEYQDLKDAYEIIHEVADFVNKARKEKAQTNESIELSKLLHGRYNSLLQSFRRYITKLKLKVLCKEKGLNKFISFTGYLFSDLLILLEHEGTMSLFNLKTPRAALLFLVVSEVEIDKSAKKENILILRSVSDGRQVKFLLQFHNSKDTQDWFKLISESIIELNEKRVKAKNIAGYAKSRMKVWTESKDLLEIFEKTKSEFKSAEEEYSKLLTELKFNEDKMKEIGDDIYKLQLQKRKFKDQLKKEIGATLIMEHKEVDRLESLIKKEDEKFLSMLGNEEEAFKEIFGEESRSLRK